MLRLILLAALLPFAPSAQAQSSFGLDAWAAWAYPTSPPERSAPLDRSGAEQHVPDSSAQYTTAQTVDRFAPPDWHPGDHPVMPGIVARGHRPGVFACAYCHLPNGAGRAENAGLAGLSAAYITAQIADFKSGARRGSAPAMTGLMTTVAKQATAQEVDAAAEYFARLKPPSHWIRVVETRRVPRTRIIPVNVLIATGNRDAEPIGPRIIEVPIDARRTVLRDSRAGYVAYVPAGSVSHGRYLVLGAGGKTLPCRGCHGSDLRGVGNIPPLAGRSPSYLFRQLYDFKAGTRAGPRAALMKAPLEHLDSNDMRSIVAYLASLPN